MQVKLRDAFPQIEELSEPGGRKRWRLPPGTTGRMADPTVEDLAALHRGAELARQSGDPATAEALDRLSDRLRARLPAQQRSRLEPDIAALLEADGVALRPGPRERIPPETLRNLREAILAGVWIEADHRARASGLVSRNARLGPLAMLLGEGRQYLVAHSAWAGEVRLFALAGLSGSRSNMAPSPSAQCISATTAPMPGIDISRRQTGTCHASWRTLRSRSASSRRNADRARRRGSVAASSIGLPAASSRILCSNPPRDMMPTSSPKFRRNPRNDIYSVMNP